MFPGHPYGIPGQSAAAAAAAAAGAGAWPVGAAAAGAAYNQQYFAALSNNPVALAAAQAQLAAAMAPPPPPPTGVLSTGKSHLIRCQKGHNVADLHCNFRITEKNSLQGKSGFWVDIVLCAGKSRI